MTLIHPHNNGSTGMTYNYLKFDVADKIATITVNRPDKLNALNDATIRELDAAITEAQSRADVGGVILTGEGRAFVAGADIGELSAQTPLEATERSRRGQSAFSKFESSLKPTIAAVNGFALGGGCELAMSCHIRIASSKAKLGQPEVKLGIVPGYGGTQRLARLTGRGAALRLLMTGDMIDATEALRIGLVDQIVEPEQLIDSSRALMTVILSNAPLAVAGCIELVNRGLEVPLSEANLIESDAFGLLSSTADKNEGMSAFLEKRAPVFSGR